MLVILAVLLPFLAGVLSNVSTRAPLAHPPASPPPRRGGAGDSQAAVPGKRWKKPLDMTSKEGEGGGGNKSDLKSRAG